MRMIALNPLNAYMLLILKFEQIDKKVVVDTLYENRYRFPELSKLASGEYIGFIYRSIRKIKDAGYIRYKETEVLSNRPTLNKKVIFFKVTVCLTFSGILVKHMIQSDRLRGFTFSKADML